MAESGDETLAWIDAGGGYTVALDGTKLVCRNAKGKRLASVPKKVKTTDVAEQMLALRDWLTQHERDCIDTVESWMLRSLPTPREVLLKVWEDPTWRSPLENAVVTAVATDGSPNQEQAGFFKGVEDGKGVGVVDLDGETQWLDTATVAIPHPILLEELSDWRELATELSLEQGISQLFRETHERAASIEDASTSIGDFTEGHFEQLNHVLGKCRTLGYRVRGGFACSPVWESGKLVEARYWIGSDYPESETYTGELLWVDEGELTLKLGSVGPVAFSEGMRMASAIYAARKIEEKEED